MNRLVKIAWPIVLGMMLTAAGWSISDQLIRWSMPPWLAYGLSLMFDAAGLLCAEYARRAVTRGTPAALPRLSILAFATISGVLNFHHGRIIGGFSAGLAFASTSLLVELLFELHRRDARDQELYERRLVAEMMPKVPFIAWVMFPVRSWNTVRAAVGARLDVLDPMQDNRPDKPPHPSGRADATVRSAIRAALVTMPGASAEDIARQLAHARVDVSADEVRLLSEQPAAIPGTVRHLPAPGAVTIADTVRTQVSFGITDPVDVLAEVRAVHGQSVRADTVMRTLRRLSGQAGQTGTAP